MSTDPYAALSDQAVLDLFMTGFTSGAATVLNELVASQHPDTAQLRAQHLGQRVFNDPAMRASILESVRRTPQVVQRDEAATFSILDVDGGERS